MGIDSDIIKANNILFKRYLDKINIATTLSTKEYMLNFCEIALKTKMQQDKHSRWLGFLQGVMFSNGLIDIGEERDISRVLFQNIYIKYGIKQDTIEVDTSNCGN
jgi:hypothetical protein